MKKTILMIFVSLMSFFAFGQLPLYQFEDAWVVPPGYPAGTPAAPPNWVVINEFGPQQKWIQTIPGNAAQPPYGGTGHSAFLAKENVAPEAAIPSDWLVTSAFPMTANAQLAFQSRLTVFGDSGGVYKVYIAPFNASNTTVEVTDFTVGGVLLTTYTEAQLDPLNMSQWTPQTLAIPTNATLWPVGTMVRIAFVMQGDDKDRWFLDEVMVAATCNAPTGASVSATTTSTATLSWTNPTATQWEIEVLPDTATPTGVGQLYSGGLPFVKTGLTPCINYKYFVRAKCADGGTSSWVGPVFFKTRCLGETCDNPLVIPPGNQSVTGNTVNFSDFYEGVSGTGCGSVGNYLAGNDVVYTYTPNATGNYNISLGGTGGAAGVFIYSNCANIGVACIGGGTASAAVPFVNPAFAMTAGTTYYFVISTNGAPQTTAYTLSIQQVFCPAPTAGTATAVTATGATLGWTAGTAGASSWQMVVQPVGSGLPSGAVTPATVTSNSNPVTGTTAGAPFASATTYEFYVRESCPGGQFSIWAGPFLFTTAQVPTTLNLTQNFDSGIHSFTLNNGSQINKWVVGSATSNSPSKSLYITNDNGITNAYTPTAQSVVQAYRDIQMPAVIGQLLLTFDWKGFGEAGSDYMRVWIVPATFTPTPGTQITAVDSGGMQIGGNLLTNLNWLTATNVITAPAAWNNQVMRLVFEWRNDPSFGSQPAMAVDNINLSKVTCPQPIALTLGSLTTTTAVVNWTPPAILPSSYDLYVTNSATDVPTAATVPTQQNILGTTATITPLTIDTFYYVYVRSHCSATDQSYWTGPLSLSTPQVPALMNYTQNFDSGPSNFTLSNGTQPNKWFVGGATYNSASNSLYISNDDGLTNSYNITAQSVVHAYRDITLPGTIPSGEVLLQFDWKSIADTGDYFRVWSVPLSFIPTFGTQITAAASGGTQIGGNFTGSSAWVTSNNVIPIPAAQLGTTRRIIFEWFNNTVVGNQPPAAIDNINFKVITCPAPSALTLGTVTTASAAVSWTAPTAAPANYNVYYSTSATPPTDATVPLVTVPGNTTTAFLSGLADSTYYNVWVRSNCGGAAGTSFWIGPLTFLTPQIPAVLPYAQAFDGPTHQFTLSNGAMRNKWIVGGATFNSPSSSLYISNDEGVTNNYTFNSAAVVHAYRDITIPIGAVNLDFYFDWKNVAEINDYVRVWRVPLNFTPTAGTAITALAGSRELITTANLYNSANWQIASYNVPATSIANTTQRFVFEWVNNSGTLVGTPAGAKPAAIDNIDIKVLTCPKPTNLTATGIGMTFATLGWTEAGSASQWAVYVVPANDPVPPSATTTGTAATNTILYTGLTPETFYKYYVRALCGPADVSRWAGPYFFNTAVCAAAEQCPVNFILTDSGNNGWGTTTMSVTQNGMPIGTLGPQLAAGSGPVTVTLQLCKGLPYEVFFNTGGTNPGESGLQIVNPFNNQTVFQRVAGTVAADQNTIIYNGMASCSAITCPQPTDLVSETVVNVPNATRLSWTPGGTETQWEVVIQPQSASFPSSAPATSIIVNSPFYVLPNLVEGQLYEFYVRALCGTNDKSFWSGELKFSLFNPPVCANVVVTDADDVIIAPDTEYTICPGEVACLDFDASYYAGAAQTDSYEVTSIPFVQPFPTLGGTELPITLDDIWSPKIDLPFEFCFMGTAYNAVQVGTNGLVTFNANQPWGVSSGFAFTQTIPNATFPQRNAIYGVYQDTNPRPDINNWDNPNINYQILGNYPCRALVVSYNELANHVCNSNSDFDRNVVGAQSSQIVIYEVTNIIEVYVKRRTACTAWNSGSGLIGIQNAAGTVAYTPPGRNTGAWSATEEAWRFTPNGAVATVDFEWLKDDVHFSDNSAISVCAPVGTTVMKARASYTTCSGATVVRESDFTINVGAPIIPDIEPVDLTKCGNGENVTFDLSEATSDTFTDPTGYNFTYYPTEQDAIDQTNAIAAPGAFVTNVTTTVWVRITKGVLPCFITRSFLVEINNVPPVFGITPDTSICDGTSTTIAVVPDATEDLTGATYSWTLDGNPLADTTDAITVTVAGTYVVTVTKNGCVGTATSVVTVVPMPVADAPVDVTACDSYVLPALSADNNYFTGTGGTGTALTAGDIIASSQTIFVYAVAPTLAACTDENSFVVTINTTPVIDSPIADVTVCDIYVLPALSANENYFTGTGGTGTAMAAGDVITTSQTIYVYEGTATTPNCTNEASFELTIVPTPVADAPGDVTVCGSYILPALSADNNYYTGSGGTGTLLNAGSPVNATQLIYVYAVAQGNATCNDENSFTVTINQIPVIDSPVVDIDACDSYTLPVLSANESYYTGSGGTGTTLNAGDVISTSQTIYVYEETGTIPNCSSEASFAVTIVTSPVADAPADVTECDQFLLPALSAGNNYYTGPGGTGTALNAGDPITSTQLIYVYAVAQANGACTDENTFTVNIIPTPQFNLGGPYVACFAGNVTVAVGNANFNLADANYVWTVNGSPAGDNSSSIDGTEFGMYEVTVTVGTCFHSEKIEVFQDTTVIELAFTDICEDNVYTLEVSDVDGSFNPDTATYSWTGPEGFSSTERMIVPDALGEYMVTVTTADGCISIDTFEVISTACDVPRGISPNNDGMNDEFDLTSLGVRKISIFNRYGVEVYSKSNYTKEWHGQGKGGEELPTGTYFYMIERSTGESLTGWVYINRQD